VSDHTHKAIDDLRAELAAYKAEANKVTQEMGSEILRSHIELEQQRTRAEGAEQELRDLLLSVKHCHASTVHAIAVREINPALGSVLVEAGALAAARAHLAGVDVATLGKDELTSTHAVTNWWEMRKLLAAAREVLS